MKLKVATRRELQGQLKAAKAVRSKADAEIAALEHLLAVASGDDTSEATAKRRASRRGKRNRTGTTVADVIANLIHRYPGNDRAAITQQLKKDGIKLGGKTRVSTRVYNELWRMEQAQKVTQRNGKYFPVR